MLKSQGLMICVIYVVFKIRSYIEIFAEISVVKTVGRDI